MTLWIACPVYRDVESFLILREHLLREVPDEFRPVHFVVLDDSSGTDASISDLSPFHDVRVLTPPFNLGHQRGIVYAVRFITAGAADDDIIVTMDSDGEDSPDDVPRLLKELTGSPSDPMRLVLARRTSRREGLLFRFFYLFFKGGFRALTGTTITTGNFAAYRGGWAKRRLLHPHFDLAYSSTLVTLDANVRFVPCARGTRYAGQSRMGFFRLVMHGIRMLMPFVDRIAVRALLGFSTVLLASLLGSCAVIAIKLSTDLAIPGWATYSLLTLVVLSVVSLGNLTVLFAVFSQSKGISLANLEGATDEFP